MKRKKKSKLSWGKRRTRSKRRMMAELDAECRQRVMDRDQTCQLRMAEKCTGDNDLQWSHILTRARTSIRWDEANSVMACRACHHFWHMNIGQGMLWFQSKYPERAEHIRRVLQGTSDFGYTEIEELYKQLS